MDTEVKDLDNPFELVRIVRAYDPCLACAVHVLDIKGASKEVKRFRI
jgi:hydrogenase large subunit